MDPLMNNPNALKKFCNVQAKTTFCIRNGIESFQILLAILLRNIPARKTLVMQKSFKKIQGIKKPLLSS